MAPCGGGLLVVGDEARGHLLFDVRVVVRRDAVPSLGLVERGAVHDACALGRAFGNDDVEAVEDGKIVLLKG